MVSTSSAENSPVTAVNTSNASLSYHELDSLSMSTLGTPVGLHIPHWGSVQRKHNKWLTNIGLYYRPNVDYAELADPPPWGHSPDVGIGQHRHAGRYGEPHVEGQRGKRDEEVRDEG
eukprot:CAMPEP_0178992846 /NCGR_PEP_ID=MMETSP0795-20121207/6351_1 /TAXON_ID=88552 /ORGANISM="Amoebophrya sp., Strain Ameob2" /LENGTH=116 /DNA_ID=CAMNT_0020684793 /DNA_START=346 /DNA_END=695 /DNA_ORIENTATION=+